MPADVLDTAHSTVFTLDAEPILPVDGAQKHGCERSAARRFCQALSERYLDLSILLVEDVLFANAPHLRQITGYGWRYVLNVKPDSHKSLFQQFASRQARGQVKELRETDEQGVQHYYAWISGLWLNGVLAAPRCRKDTDHFSPAHPALRCRIDEH